MIVVDSSVWIDYFNGVVTAQTDALHYLFGQQQILMGDIILMEVLQGFRKESDYRQAKELLGLLEFAPMLGKEVAIQGAENYRFLRTKGVTVRKTIDVMIGTFCLMHGYSLLHSDRDFEPMERFLGLDVVR